MDPEAPSPDPQPTRPIVKKQPMLLDPTQVLAKDLMRTDLLVLSADDSVESAIAQFEEYHVSGAPVTDGAGKPLGVLSASDIARRDHVDSGRLDTAHHGRIASLDEDSEGIELDNEVFGRDDYSPELLGRVRIGEWMSPGIVSVGPESTLAEICRLMVAESIHRVFVVEGEKLHGVVTTSDVVRLLAAE
jgi:CBS domain-containing protein